MRLFFVIGAVAFFLIGACMVYLLKVGVALRTQPLIKPSVLKGDETHLMAEGASRRLLPVLRETPYFLLGLAPLDEFRGPFLQKMIFESEKILNKKIQILDGSSLGEEGLQKCSSPCWILLPVEQANNLDPNPWLNLNLDQKSRKWASLTVLPFSRDDAPMRPECRDQKKISFSCVTEISLAEVWRKLKRNSERVFFMRGYLEQNYFLFYEQNPKASLPDS